MLKQLLLTLVGLYICAALSAQNIIKVPEDERTIQRALNQATAGTTIQVAAGTYFESLKWPKIDSIRLISEDGPAETIIDGSGLFTVLTIEGKLITSETVIDGFTLQNGVNIIGGSDFWSSSDGGGIRTLSASPHLKNLIIQNNLGEGESAKGAGAYLNDFNGIIECCHFINNELNTARRAHGAGLYVIAIGSPLITQCVFDNNRAFTEGWSYGGGI